METQASREEYTKQKPQLASILEFPLKNSSEGRGETELLEG
jgi:hypothetical protein